MMKKVLIVLFLLVFVNLSTYSNENDFTNTILKMQIERVKEKNQTRILLQTIINNDVELAKKLFKMGYNANETYSKIPAAFFAVYLKRHEILDIMLDNGLNPDTKYFGITLIDFAIYENDNKSVELLLKYDANPNLKSCGKTPLNFAILNNNKDIAKTLIKYGAVVDKKTQKLLKKKKYKDFNCLVEPKVESDNTSIINE